MTTSKQRRGQPGGLSFRETCARRPYRSLLGTGANADADAEEMMQRVGCAIAVLGEEPKPLSQKVTADALAVLAAGRMVLLISNDRRLRDFAMREILAMAGPAGGAA